MRICLVNECFLPFALGGSEWSLDALARALARRGHRIIVLTPSYGAAPDEERDRVPFVPLPFKVSAGRTLAPAKWRPNPLFWLCASPK